MNNFLKYLLAYNINKKIVDKFDDIVEDLKKKKRYMELKIQVIAV